MSPSIAIIIGIILAIAGTVLAFIFITPEQKRSSLPKFFQVVADIFNFKMLLLEKILKALYIFSTLAVLFGGFFMLFSGYRVPSYFSSSSGGFYSLAGYGLLVMIGGPIVVRLVYEVLMMFILLVKNTTEINKKMGGTTAAGTPDPFANPTAAPVQPQPQPQPEAPAYEPHYQFCSQCGTKYDVNQGGCPNHCEDKA